jgi:hypothetical protein
MSESVRSIPALRDEARLTRPSAASHVRGDRIGVRLRHSPHGSRPFGFTFEGVAIKR